MCAKTAKPLLYVFIDMKCIICNAALYQYNIRTHMRQQHGRTLQNSNLRHYLLSLQQPIAIRNYTCTDCMREFPNNRRYYTHRFRYHTLNQANNMVKEVGGALLEGEDQLMSLVQHRRSLKVLTAVRKPKSTTMEWAGFLDDTLVSFSNALQQFVAREGARSITLSVEFTHVYHNDEGGEREMGLPETRVSHVAKAAPLNIANVLQQIFERAKTRMSNSEVSSSGWVFDHFVSVTLRALTDTIVNSGMSNNLIGGKGHRSTFVLDEASVAGSSSGDDDDGDVTMTTADKAFINDAESEDEGDIEQYWHSTADVAEELRVRCNNAEEEQNCGGDSADDYLPDDGEVVDTIAIGEIGDDVTGDAATGDLNVAMVDGPLDLDIYEVNNLTGVNLTPNDILMMNTKINEVIVKSTGTDGYCTYEAILNGLYVQRTATAGTLPKDVEGWWKGGKSNNVQDTGRI